MDEFGQTRRPVERQRDALGLCLQLEHGDELNEELGEPDRLTAEAQRPAFDLRDVKQPFDQMREMFGTAADHTGGLQRVLALVALEQLGIAIDRVERRTDFVADAGEEAGLGLVCCLGGFLGGAQPGDVILLRARAARALAHAP